MASTTEKSVLDELLSPLQEKLAELEELRLIHPREVLRLTAFVRVVVYGYVQKIGSGRLLISESQSADEALALPEVKRSTLFDAFNRFPAQWFATLLGIVLSSVVWHEVPELAELGKLYCIDGSLFPALGKMVWAEYKAGQPLYRLVAFSVGNERYMILTDRCDLTTFQVILLYAYRWQVELVFRFLKRTMNGRHFFSTSPNGVTIQFYLLIAEL